MFGPNRRHAVGSLRAPASARTVSILAGSSARATLLALATIGCSVPRPDIVVDAPADGGSRVDGGLPADGARIVPLGGSTEGCC